MSFRTIARLLALAVLGAMLVYSFHYRFTHPELTETQLFLATWGVDVVGGVLILVVFLLTPEKDRK